MRLARKTALPTAAHQKKICPPQRRGIGGRTARMAAGLLALAVLATPSLAGPYPALPYPDEPAVLLVEERPLYETEPLPPPEEPISSQPLGPLPTIENLVTVGLDPAPTMKTWGLDKEYFGVSAQMFGKLRSIEQRGSTTGNVLDATDHLKLGGMAKIRVFGIEKTLVDILCEGESYRYVGDVNTGTNYYHPASHTSTMLRLQIAGLTKVYEPGVTRSEYPYDLFDIPVLGAEKQFKVDCVLFKIDLYVRAGVIVDNDLRTFVEAWRDGQLGTSMPRNGVRMGGAFDTSVFVGIQTGVSVLNAVEVVVDAHADLLKRSYETDMRVANLGIAGAIDYVIKPISVLVKVVVKANLPKGIDLDGDWYNPLSWSAKVEMEWKKVWEKDLFKWSLDEIRIPLLGIQLL